MSDIQEPLMTIQRRIQQRQILAMLGINQWMQPESVTIKMADMATSLDTESNTERPVIKAPSTDRFSNESSSVNASNLSASNPNASNPNALNLNPLNLNESESNTVLVETDATNVTSTSNGFADTINQLVSDDKNNDADAQEHHEHAATEHSPVTYHFDSVIHDASMARSHLEQTQLEPINHNVSKDGGAKKVAPFDLQGGRYGDWVVLVDIQALTSDSQKLWQNIVQSLSITCETTSFPICEGMDTADLANASLAGYVFRIGLHEEINIAALTALPEGLFHPNLTAAPTLDDMLADSDSKRQLWEQISH